MVKEEDIQTSLLDAEETSANLKAESNLRGLLASYSYGSPAATPQSLPRRSPRNLSTSSSLKKPSSTVKAEADSVTLPLTPTSLAKSRIARNATPNLAVIDSTSSSKRKREAEDDDCLPMPPSLKDSVTKNSNASKALKRQKRSYAPPETYAHLKGLPDHLADELDVVFCGINPGYKSAESGFHYAHPVNHFWRCLHQGGFTPTRLPPSDGYLLPEQFNVGLTNIVERPSAEAGELSKAEIEASVQALLTKVHRYRPRVVCFVGKLIWDAVARVLAKHAVGGPPPAPKRGKGAKRSGPFVYDHLQPYKLIHTEGSIVETLFFVVPSTSGRVVSHQLADKVVLFAKLKSILEDIKSSSCDTSSFSTVSVPSPEPLTNTIKSDES